MRTKPFIHLCLSLLAVSLICVSCKKPKSRINSAHPLPDSPRIADCEPGRVGGELRLTLSGSPRNFNPLTSDAASLEISRLLFAGLTRMDWQKQESRPALAESWQVAPDSKTWTFKLRRGLRWSDNQPLTVDDVLFTWNEIIYARKAPAYLRETFSFNGTNFTVSKLDETTIQVVTPEVFPAFIEFFGSVPVLPKHVFDNTSPKGNTNLPFSQMACSGPFRPKNFTAGRTLVLERNPNYWVVDSKGQRLPYLDHIILTIPEDALAMFKAGEIDLLDRVPLEAEDEMQKMADSGKIQFLSAGITPERDILWFNQNTETHPTTGQPIVAPTKLKWFRDQRFRQAVALGIDRERIVQMVYGGRAEPSYGFIGAENKYWNNPEIPKAKFKPAQARALLAAMGLRDTNHDGVLEDAEGHPIEITFNTNIENPARQATAQLIVEDLAKIGIKLRFQPLPFKTLSEKISEGQDYECVLLGLGGGGLDPVSTVPTLLSASPTCQWFPSQTSPSTDWEARIDALMDKQANTLDLAARKKAFDEVQTILAEQLPMIYTVSPQAYSAASKNIGNLRPSPLTPYRATWNIEELYWK